MTDVYVDHLGYALGSHRHGVEASAAAGRMHNAAADFLASGFAWHHVCAEAETAYDLARAAVSSIGDGLGSPDAIVYATCIPANANLGDPARFAETSDVKHSWTFRSAACRPTSGWKVPLSSASASRPARACWARCASPTGS